MCPGRAPPPSWQDGLRHRDRWRLRGSPPRGGPLPPNAGARRSRRLQAERRQVDAHLRKVGNFERQQLAIPSGLLGEAVVGEDVGARLALAEWASSITGTEVIPSLRAAILPLTVETVNSIDEGRCREYDAPTAEAGSVPHREPVCVGLRKI